VSDYSVEGLNPTRRYKWFRPRQAARGFISNYNTSHDPAAGVLNNSTNAQLLVVRAVIATPAPTGGADFGLFYVQGNPGTAGGTVRSLYPDTGNLAGQMWLFDTTTDYQIDFGLQSVLGNVASAAVWPYDFPCGIVPPGWSLGFQVQGGPGYLTVSMLWEAIALEELDYY
jgi:hypothetical protein